MISENHDGYMYFAVERFDVDHSILALVCRMSVNGSVR